MTFSLVESTLDLGGASREGRCSRAARVDKRNRRSPAQPAQEVAACHDALRRICVVWRLFSQRIHHPLCLIRMEQGTLRRKHRCSGNLIYGLNEVVQRCHYWRRLLLGCCLADATEFFQPHSQPVRGLTVAPAIGFIDERCDSFDQWLLQLGGHTAPELQHLRAILHSGKGLQQRVQLHGGKQFEILLQERLEVGAQSRIVLQGSLQADVVGNAGGKQAYP